jgi:hypothetical protein
MSQLQQASPPTCWALLLVGGVEAGGRVEVGGRVEAGGGGMGVLPESEAGSWVLTDVGVVPELGAGFSVSIGMVFVVTPVDFSCVVTSVDFSCSARFSGGGVVATGASDIFSYTHRNSWTAARTW